MSKVVFFVLGPPASGKTTLCGGLRPQVADLAGSGIGYVCGDVFSLLSYPWQATDQQLDLKYAAMNSTIAHAVEHYDFVLVEDLPRRQTDLEGMQKNSRRCGAVVSGVRLTGREEAFGPRNALRQLPHRMSDAMFARSMRQQEGIEYEGFAEIDAEQAPEKVMALAMDEIRGALINPTRCDLSSKTGGLK